MISFQKKSLEDLEFPSVLQQVAAGAITELGKLTVLKIKPYATQEKTLTALHELREFNASLSGDNRIPNHGFESIDKELHLLEIENSTLELQGFRKVVGICETIFILQRFFDKNKEFYIYLNALSQRLSVPVTIQQNITAIIDKHGFIKDNATPELAQIRQSLKQVKSKVNSSFTKAMQHATQMDYLDDIRESIVEGKRVLAVKAMHRRKVKGVVLGSSKTGIIVYIEPRATLEYENELSNLLYQEQEEVKKILKALTEFLRPHGEVLQLAQEYLAQIDALYAKAKYAKRINGCMPRITKSKNLKLVNAYHPLLWISNKQRKEKTIPQTIGLNHDKRIIVISGPNAGGKSITLKTVGLLQVMLQSGLLIPVDPESEFCFFDKILTDIGDNQSIENHLSTYSYRLKRMNQFLKKCNSNTLFLIDEFGTGSDPELGGALAETFLEVFYEREAFGIITTHYTNLKLLANELPHAINANMQFDNKTLQPLYILFMGEAGSSYTFEVAQKNGIPYSLINRAKKKIDGEKVRFDKTIANLQRERSKLRITSEQLKSEEEKAKIESKSLEETQQRVQHKLERYQELFDANQRLIYLGKKIDAMAQSYANHKRKRQLVDEFMKIVAVENSKRKPVKPKQKKQVKKEKHEIQQEVQKEIAVIRKKKKSAKKAAVKKEAAKPKVAIKIGDRVRMIDGKAIGTVDTLEKNKAVVNYGMFTTNVSVDKLELV